MGRPRVSTKQVALASLDAFVRVVATDVRRLLDGLHALTVHDGGARVGVAADSLPLGAMQGGIEQMPLTLQTKPAEMVEDCLPRWVVARQVAPGTAGAHEVEDGVEN